MKKEEIKKFDIEVVISNLKNIGDFMKQHGDIPFDEFTIVLDEYCFVFKQLNSFLGIAFSDVKEKVAIIRGNNERFKDHKGFFHFIEMEMGKKIHIYNGDNNKKLKASQEFMSYNSTARNLLRMMWLLTFIRVTFSECRDYPEQKLSETFSKAYDSAFGTKHSWIVRKGAKLAILASTDRKRLVQCIIGHCDEKQFKAKNDQFLSVLIPIHQALWDHYKKNGLVDLQ